MTLEEIALAFGIGFPALSAVAIFLALKWDKAHGKNATKVSG